jgi:hypothetical protein
MKDWRERLAGLGSWFRFLRLGPDLRGLGLGGRLWR